jgi:UPF0755 protein
MPKRKSKKRSILPFLFILLILAGALILFLYAANYFLSIQNDAYQLYGPPDPGLTIIEKFNLSRRLVRDRDYLLELTEIEAEHRFDISPGESPYQVADNLYNNQLIPSSISMIDYLIYKGYDTKLLTGSFIITTPNTPIEIALTLIDPNAIILEVFILPGWRVEEIADHLAISGIMNFDRNEFLSIASSLPIDSPLPPNLPLSASVEGFLAPGTYVIQREISEDELLDMFMQDFAANIDDDLITALSNNGLSLFEAVTLASIIEREVVLDEEKPLIASVFYNRLNAGWMLETDPTVQYAVSSPGNWWPNPLTYADLEFDSPYNTYLYYGLPPGPISNPNIDTLRAVAYPDESPYFFFRAKCDDSHSHSFSITYEEHLEAGCD